MKKILFLVVSVFMLMTGSAFASSYMYDYDMNGYERHDSYTTDNDSYDSRGRLTITAEGIGSKKQAAPQGYRAAKMDAYRNLLEQINGVRVTGDSLMQDFILKNDTVRTHVEGIVKNAYVKNQYKDSDGYHVVLEIPMFGRGSIAETVVPHIPAPTYTKYCPPELSSYRDDSDDYWYDRNRTTDYSMSTNGNYTGLIVDCRGLGIQTAMAPGILTNGRQAVYGLQRLSHDEVINRGYVGYSHSLVSGVSRAGSNPLIVRAISVDRYVNAVIGTNDANRILAEDKLTGFLDRGNVIFVR